MFQLTSADTVRKPFGRISVVYMTVRRVVRNLQAHSHTGVLTEMFLSARPKLAAESNSVPIV